MCKLRCCYCCSSCIQDSPVRCRGSTEKRVNTGRANKKRKQNWHVHKGWILNTLLHHIESQPPTGTSMCKPLAASISIMKQNGEFCIYRELKYGGKKKKVGSVVLMVINRKHCRCGAPCSCTAEYVANKQRLRICTPWLVTDKVQVALHCKTHPHLH